MFNFILKHTGNQCKSNSLRVFHFMLCIRCTTNGHIYCTSFQAFSQNLPDVRTIQLDVLKLVSKFWPMKMSFPQNSSYLWKYHQLFSLILFCSKSRIIVCMGLSNANWQHVNAGAIKYYIKAQWSKTLVLLLQYTSV